jgi:glycosyltransferase involved in cell wall biosynthesis
LTETVGSSNMRIALVDDVSLYSQKLVEGFKEHHADCKIYGPISSPSSKSPEVLGDRGNGELRVWSQNKFPLQIFKKVLTDKPSIVHVQFEFYGIHSYGPLYSVFGLPIALLLLRLLRVRTVVTLHMIIPRGQQLAQIRDTSPSSFPLPIGFLDAFFIVFYKLVSLLSSAVIVHTEVFRKCLLSDYGIKPAKVVVIPHGIETTGPSKNSIPQTKAGVRPILYFGVISPRKGLETLLSAFALVAKKRDDCELWLAGTTPPYYHDYKNELQESAKKLDLDGRARFFGPVSSDVAHGLFNEASFIVLPYYYSLSASGALSWALGHGRPVIASATDYFKEELSHTKFGLLVPPHNKEKLAEAMETLLTRQDLCESLSESAKEMSLSRSWQAVAGMTLDFYQELAKEPNSSLLKL